jgi:16S rRNA (adenine1518-N6/adenine1519-N6)-dimethyltransferase
LNLVRFLADSAEVDGRDVVLEVGTGTGSLTTLLAPRAAAVVSVEISRQLQQMASEELIGCDNVVLLQQDVLRNKNSLAPQVLQAVADQIAQGADRRLKLVANLPYHVGTPVISNLLSTPITPHSMTVTIQKELADRILARPGTKDYGSLSVWIQSQCDVQLLRVLPPSVFWPRPKVHSAMVRIVVRPDLRAAIPDRDFFHTFVRALFTHRRKFLRGGLVGAFGKVMGKPAIDGILAAEGLAADARAEQLDVGRLLALSERFRPLERACDF